MKRLQLFGNPKVPIWLQGPMDWYESVGVELAVTWGQIPQWVWEVRNMRFFRAQTIWLEGTQDDIRDRRRAVLGMARGIISQRDAKEMEIDNLYPLIPIDTISPRLANLICVAYKDAPERTFTSTENDGLDSAFEDMYEELNINEVMDQAYRAALFTNSVLILWSEEEHKFLVLTPEYFRIEENGIWVARRTGVPGVPRWARADGEISVGTGQVGEIVYDVWNDTTHEVRNSGGKIQVAQCEENKYGMFPGVLLKLTPSNDLYGAGITEAADLNAITNLIRLFALRIGFYQGFSVAVLLNAGGQMEKNDVRIGPGKMLPLNNRGGEPGSNPDFKFVSPDGKFEELENFRKSLIATFERNQDLPGFLVDEIAGAPPTGVALQVLERQLNNRRRDHLPALRRTEKTLVKFVQKLAKLQKRNGLVADTFEIQYAEPQEFTDKASELEYDLMAAQSGLTTPSAFYRKYSKTLRGVTDQEALVEMKKNKSDFSFLGPIAVTESIKS